MNQMAAFLSTSAPTYNKWETTIRPPRKALECLAELTGLSFALLDDDTRSLPDGVILNPQVKSKAVPADEEQIRWQKHLANQVSTLGTQGELAEKTGLDTAQLSKFLTGKKRITLRTMFRIATVTGNYDWYTAPPADHEGERLRDYLEFKGHEQQWLADQLGNAKSSISGLLTQRSIKQSRWAEISQVLGVSKDTILESLTPNSSNKETYEQQSDNYNALKSMRVRSASASLTQYVVVRSIPGNMRAGFNYQKMTDKLPTRQVPLSQFNRINSQLTQQQIDEEVKRYDIITIGNDHMEPGLRAGQEILAYRLYNDAEEVAYPVGRWSDEHGVMALETTSGRLFIGRVLDNKLLSTGAITFVTDDPRGGTATFQREQVINIWKLETYIGGPVV